LSRQLYSAAISTNGRIVIGGILTTIARFLGIEPNPEDRVLEPKWLDQATFEIMNFCKVVAGCLCWIYPRDRLLPLANVDRTILLHRANLYWEPSDAEVVQPAPHHLAPHSSKVGPSFSSQPPAPDYANLEDILRSIQEVQLSLRAFVASKNAALRDCVQKHHDELRGMFATHNQYFQDYRACLET